MTQYQLQSVGRSLRSNEDKSEPIVIDLADDEVMNRMGRAIKHKVTDTVVMSKKNDG